jgi:diguanylate cyclase (GGDEF)-like protein
MAFDLDKNLTRAKRALERNRPVEAIEAYQEILNILPNHVESMQALGDLYTRQNDPERAAQHYGMLFDRLLESRDTVKAAAVFTRFLKNVQQPPERVARYANLLQKQNRRDEAIEQYESAAELYLFQQRTSDALNCWEKVAALDPDNPSRHFLIGDVADRLNFEEIAVRGFLRAGQLTLGQNEVDNALQILQRAHKLAPTDRGVALVYGEALLRKGKPQDAVELLEPYASEAGDEPLQLQLGEALLENHQLERGLTVYEGVCRRTQQHFDRLFDVVLRQMGAGEESKAAETLQRVRKIMSAAHQDEAFAASFESFADANLNALPVVEFAARFYNEQNKESKYFSTLTRLFDLYYEAGNIKGACDALERIVEVDPYDIRHDERLGKLEGKADPAFLKALHGRLAKSATVSGQAGRTLRYSEVQTNVPQSPGSRQSQTLEDMIVQAEIFLQYSLEAKARDRLQKIAEEFPGEEENNERLCTLYEQAKWWPQGSKLKPKAASATGTGTGSGAGTGMKSGMYSADTLRDLTKISEITKILYRQPTPKVILSSAVTEAGKHLRATRCLATIGTLGQPPQMASEFCVSGLEPSPGPVLVKLLTALADTPPDPLGSWRLETANLPVLGEMGLQSALAVQLVDREAQTPSGVFLAGMAEPRKWKPNENYFLQSVGDQALMAVNHSKLRSLMRTLAVADEKTGLLSPGSYTDCLLAESARAKIQSTPLSVLILQVDRAREIVRQHGEEQIENYMEQLARVLLSGVRQTDIAVKYAGWAVAFIMPDTSGAAALSLADKLRRLASSVKPPWNGSQLTLSAAVAEAGVQAGYENEDIVTHLINRVDSALEEARKRGGNAVISSA